MAVRLAYSPTPRSPKLIQRPHNAHTPYYSQGLPWPPGLLEVATRCEESDPDDRPSFQTLVAALGEISTLKQPTAAAAAAAAAGAATDADADADDADDADEPDASTAASPEKVFPPNVRREICNGGNLLP